MTQGQPLYSFEAEFLPIPLAAASKMGLSRQWIESLEKHDPTRRQALAITRLVAGSPAAKALQPGDLLLAVDGKAVNRFREVERAVQKGQVNATIWRNDQERTVTIDTVALDGKDLDRVLIWAGATLQAPHRAMAAQRGIAPEGSIRCVFLLRLSGDAVRALCRSAHRGSRRAANARSRQFRKGGRRVARIALRCDSIRLPGTTPSKSSRSSSISIIGRHTSCDAAKTGGPAPNWSEPVANRRRQTESGSAPRRPLIR